MKLWIQGLLKQKTTNAVFWSVLVTAFGLTMALFSFLFGSSLNSVVKTESLLFADEYLDLSAATGFVHLNITFDNHCSYDEIVADQLAFKNNTSSGGSYVIAGTSSPINFMVDESTAASFETATICTLAAFSDKEVMESFPLPLLFADKGYQFTGNSIDNGFKCYISNYMADEILKNNHGFTDYQSIVDQKYAFTVTSPDNGSVYKMNVVNIYSVGNDDGAISDERYSEYQNKYGAINEQFYDFNSSAIFTYGPQIFEASGSLLGVDLKSSYANLRNYLGEILGDDFYSRGINCNIQFVNHAGFIEDLDSVLVIDSIYVSKDPFYGAKWSYLIAAILFFTLGLVSSYFLGVVMVPLCSPWLTRLAQCCVCCLPLFVIGLTTCIAFSMTTSLAIMLTLNFVGMASLLINSIASTVLCILGGSANGKHSRH